MPDATQNLKLKITSDTSQMRSATGGFGGLASAIAGVTAALYAGREAYKNFIEPVIQYNKEIKDASESTGMAAEELSRFVQVGDDMGVEMAQITKALEFATKNGFAPTIDSLADLADKGNAMSSTTDRAAYYTKIFGRNWAELNPILQQGGQRIREMAAAQASGLVVTQEEIDKTEELRAGLDELNDNWIALRNEIVLAVTPALIQATEKQNFWQAAIALTKDKGQNLSRFLKDDLIPAVQGVSDAEQAATVDAALLMAAKEEMLNGQSVLWEYYIQQALMLEEEGEQVDALIEQYRQLLKAKREAAASYGKIQRSTEGSSAGQSVLGGGMAQGGFVSGAGSVLVGEHGAERFTPGSGGTVSPANDPLVRAINHMVRQLPVILRDAVQKA